MSPVAVATEIIRFSTELFNVHCVGTGSVEGRALIDNGTSERATWCTALAGVWS